MILYPFARGILLYFTIGSTFFWILIMFNFLLLDPPSCFICYFSNLYISLGRQWNQFNFSQISWCKIHPLLLPAGPSELLRYSIRRNINRTTPNNRRRYGRNDRLLSWSLLSGQQRESLRVQVEEDHLRSELQEPLHILVSTLRTVIVGRAWVIS